MNYSFQYIDIILLAMIAGFIFLRLRGILGKKTGFEGKIPTQFEKEFQKIKVRPKPINENFDEEAQKEFLKGARIAYETIIIDFSESDNKLIASKPLLDKLTYSLIRFFNCITMQIYFFYFFLSYIGFMNNIFIGNFLFIV
jgi:hypothetical protein